ncbi:MAG TPA: FAD-dependent oxidoreductase [Paucimonas sp.]|nr:FAD-dependent oxidoreductase [Paucimonas sp.]
MKPVIIVGTGLAGYTVAREFRKLDTATPLIIVTADDGGFYSKPMLSNAFALGKGASQLVTQAASQLAAQLNATVLTATLVKYIDAANKTIATSAGDYEYGKLVLATGARPIRLALEGDAAEDVISVNHVGDYAYFRARLAAARRHVTILGAGLIGCEFADDLAGAGYGVTLVDPNPVPLAALAAPALSEGLHAALSTRGVTMRLGTTATRVDRNGEALRVTLADGSSFDTGVVLSAVGLRADLSLAQSAQLKTGRGITVDRRGQTSAEDVFAVGDGAEYACEDGSARALPYIAPLMTAARAIARTLAGHPTDIELKPAPVIVKTPSFPLALVPPPPEVAAAGQWHTQVDGPHTICRFYDAQGVMRGFGVAPQEAGKRQQLLAELGGAQTALRPTLPA